MTIPKWSSAAFAFRLNMSSDKLSVIVEGKFHDKSFYDRILLSNSTASKLQYEIYSAEEVSLPAVAAGTGGKTRVLRLYDEYRKTSKLVQISNSGRSFMLFFVDQDYDHVGRSKRRSKHVIYTEHCDVEAEIFAHGDHVHALSSTMSIPLRTAQSLVAGHERLLHDLADLWREWITLCAVSVVLKSRSAVRISRRSCVNEKEFGFLDPQKVTDFRLELRATAGAVNIRALEAYAETRVANIYASGLHPTLVKGKWIPYFFKHLLSGKIPARNLDNAQFISAIVRAELDSIDFGEDWVRYYHDRIDSVMTAA